MTNAERAERWLARWGVIRAALREGDEHFRKSVAEDLANEFESVETLATLHKTEGDG
jgi:hypothetical protein